MLLVILDPHHPFCGDDTAENDIRDNEPDIDVDVTKVLYGLDK
tara:strand:+ start:1313 stop:1441 length:129 start_codon:yes stop_codon:yes gene_type:complete